MDDETDDLAIDPEDDSVSEDSVDYSSIPETQVHVEGHPDLNDLLEEVTDLRIKFEELKEQVESPSDECVEFFGSGMEIVRDDGCGNRQDVQDEHGLTDGVAGHDNIVIPQGQPMEMGSLEYTGDEDHLPSHSAVGEHDPRHAISTEMVDVTDSESGSGEGDESEAAWRHGAHEVAARHVSTEFDTSIPYRSGEWRISVRSIDVPGVAASSMDVVVGIREESERVERVATIDQAKQYTE